MHRYTTSTQSDETVHRYTTSTQSDESVYRYTASTQSDETVYRYTTSTQSDETRPDLTGRQHDAEGVMRQGYVDGDVILRPRRQGLTLVHYSAQRKRFLWDRGCVQRLFRGCLRDVKRYQGVLRVYFVSETAQVELKSGRV